MSAKLLVLAAVLVSGAAVAADSPGELRVCADPDNLPFSNRRLEGFENQIATMIARDLNVPVQYTWSPHRGAFLDKTLMAHRCDVLMGVPSGYDAVLATKPYYTSSYVFVYAKNRGLELRSFNDPVLRKVRIGLQAFGDDGANAPPVHALSRRGIVHNIAAFSMLGDDNNSPGKIIDAVAAGEIDVAIVWGPFGGYFARRQRVALEVRPVSPSVDGPMPFTFDMSVGVRPGETAFKQRLEGALDRRRHEIRKVLEAHGVPLVGGAHLSSFRANSNRSQKGS
jgi:quinoprotein dehydrogenase-associated probable ABC transporter substrate-binding protein